MFGLGLALALPTTALALLNLALTLALNLEALLTLQSLVTSCGLVLQTAVSHLCQSCKLCSGDFNSNLNVHIAAWR